MKLQRAQRSQRLQGLFLQFLNYENQVAPRRSQEFISQNTEWFFLKLPLRQAQDRRCLPHNGIFREAGPVHHKDLFWLWLKVALVICGLISSVLITGCSDERADNGRESAQTELLIFCGAGLQPPISELAEIFANENNLKILTDYAGAEVLLSKARLSKRGDIYIPGDKGYVDSAAAKGLILSQNSVCFYVPTIFVQKGNPREIKEIKDLLRPGIKLGLGNPDYIPVGRKARQIFEKNGISWKRIETNLKFQSATVNELCLQIQARSLDAVIVWDAVAQRYSKYGELIPIPRQQNVSSTVDAGVLKFTENCELAEKFVDFLCSEDGRAVFRKLNYRVDLPE